MNKLLNKDTSLQLALLKFCASIGVIYIHAYMLHFNYFTITPGELSAVYYVQTILSQYIARVSLAIFFVVSGYIYTMKQYQDSIWQFACRKGRSILFPYLLWNSIAIFYIYLVQIPEFTRIYFSNHLLIATFNAEQWLGAYFGIANSWFPFLYPLWFLPYLFAAFMIMHLLHKFFEQMPWLIWLLAILNIACASYIPLHTQCTGFGPLLRLLYALSFFTMGRELVKYRSFIVRRPVLYASALLFIIATAVDLLRLTPAFRWSIIAFYAGVVFMFSLTSRAENLPEKIKKSITFLAGYSFLIYLTHEFALTVLTKLIYPALPPETLYILLVYLLMPLLLTSVLIASGYLLKKLFPKVYSFLFSAR